MTERSDLASLSKTRVRVFIALFLLAILILLPRVLSLDNFVNPDEPDWLLYSANFYYALTQGDLENTFQREHPGVTITWAGVAAYWWRYPAYAQEVQGYLTGNEQIGPFLRTHGHEPLDVLVTARFLVVLMNTAALLAAFVLATRLFGWLPALGGVLLIAFDPFHVALSRMLHLDALVASLMFLSVLSFLNYSYRGQRRVDLVLSGIAAGLAWLTKSPSFFLIPFVALLRLAPVGYESLRIRQFAFLRVRALSLAWQASRALIVWGLVGLAVYVLLWPSMWVQPIDSVARVLGKALSYAGEGHKGQIFFNGAVVKGDPGFFFYPITYLWRSTPVVLVGLLLALIAFVTKRTPLDKTETRHATVALLLFALLFMLFMGLGSKKWDRYLIPIYLPLDLVAALGWSAAAYWLGTVSLDRRRRYGAAALLLLALTVQIFATVPLSPYFISYYNPLLGGTAQAPEVMTIGWGEGLDQAARYLNQKPDAGTLQVASWYNTGPFSYFFKGQSRALEFKTRRDIPTWLDLDYVLIYIHQWQRELPDNTFLDYFARQTPEHVIRIHDLDYVEIYNLQEASSPVPDFLTVGKLRNTDWAQSIRLLDYDLPPKPFAPGESGQITFYLQNIAPLEQDVSVLVRIVGADGKEWWRDEGWPWGSATSTWEFYDIWPDGHEFTIPEEAPAGYYQILLSFYDPKTLTELPATDARTGEPLGEEIVATYFVVGDLPNAPTQEPLAKLGADIELLAIETLTQDGQPLITTSPGATLKTRLFWQTPASLAQDYTVFVHLIGPDGQLITQQDQQPLAGFLRTSLWKPNDPIVDQLTLTLPTDAPTGTYEIRVGMYDPTTGQRLRLTELREDVSRDGQPAGDYVTAGSLSVR
ncbi:MAG: ArnT family glycosyltransferase [Ardenticatenaceae bacterium]